jgi:hypothetical protein
MNDEPRAAQSLKNNGTSTQSGPSLRFGVTVRSPFYVHCDSKGANLVIRAGGPNDRNLQEMKWGQIPQDPALTVPPPQDQDSACNSVGHFPPGILDLSFLAVHSWMTHSLPGLCGK